ncbi:penicillin-binding protein [Hoyosella rhizosphaerae]|uniref:Penicillin-binding protein n=1 Tax=Hoyosella rhizosphaerae TaxID=1755582 RepID=A0A916U6S6_9ACTN|nr:penicillin-binding protein [Hoyosella rhizosphaerae]GGC62721.1 penicillin-binding protein [Hoyosella rhizosphaerae]
MLLIVGVLGAAMLTACQSHVEESSPLGTIRDFTAALTDGDLPGAAALTDDPARAGDDLEGIYESLTHDGAQFAVQGLSVGDEGATFTLGAVWDLGDSAYGPREWAFSTSGTATRSSDGWRVVWRPDVVVPHLTDETTVRFRPQPPAPTDIVDRNGEVIMTEQPVHLVSVTPARARSNGEVAKSLAELLQPIDPQITAASLLSSINAGQGTTVTVVVLRDSDYFGVASALEEIPGVSVQQQSRMLSTSRELASPLFGQLQDEWDERQQQSAGWAVEIVGPEASHILAESPGIPLPDVRTEIDLEVQTAAQKAIEDLDTPAAIVAVKSSTGAVLGVAQNAAADAEGPIALSGLYPPGSAFKPITSMAAMMIDEVAPNSVVPCPPSGIYAGRYIPNIDGLDLGDIAFDEAFAQSCNTTFADLALSLSDEALHDVGMQTGLGMNFRVPGLTMVTGDVPVNTSSIDRVEAALGQGRNVASPFGMAFLAATIARGSTPAPMLLQGEPGESDQIVPPLPAELTRSIQHLMRGVVERGTASELARYRGLIGKTGTAEVDSDQAPHGWFIGIDGDLAFAVFVGSAGSSEPAVAAADRFLEPLIDADDVDAEAE